MNISSKWIDVLVNQVDRAIRLGNSDRTAFYTMGYVVGRLTEVITSIDVDNPEYHKYRDILDNIVNKVDIWRDDQLKKIGL